MTLIYLRAITRPVQDPRAVARRGASMSVTPKLCCDETKNRGACTRLTSILPPRGRDRIAVSTLCCGRSNLGSNPSHGTIDGRRVYAPQFFVSSQQKFGVMDIEAPSAGHSSRRTDHVIALK